MREIGGYIDFERYHRGEYYTDLLRLNTVRNAIYLIIREKNYRKVWIPKYLCDSIKDMLIKNGIDFQVYNIAMDFSPVLDENILDDEVVLIVNYFGQFSNHHLKRFLNIYRNIIVDNTQSFFQQPCPDIDTVYTCRKYFGVPDGAYLNLSMKSNLYDALPLDYSAERMQHILGRYENTATDYYQEFVRVDKAFEYESAKKMSLLTQNILNSIDYQTVIAQRQENFSVLHRGLSSSNRLTIENYGGLYMYPLLIESGSLLKKEIIKQKIYIPTLWPNVLKECDVKSYEYYLADNLILLPIDQRYSIDDMQYMIEKIQQIISERSV